MTNADAARILARLATMLEIDGANPFRVRAYREAARVIESQGEPIEGLAAEAGALEALPGIGKDLAQKIRDLVQTGTTAIYEEMRLKVPLGVVALTELQGLGPRRVKTLHDALEIRNLEDLEVAAKAGRLRGLPGFGEKVEQNVLKALASARGWSGRTLLSGAWPVAGALVEHIRRVPGVRQVEAAGSFRRRKETVGDLDLLVTGGAVDEVMKAFVTYGEVAEVLGRGETKSSVRLGNGLQVDLRLVPPESFGAALMYFTGSKEHNIELRKIAIGKGLLLNEYGLLRGEAMVAGRTEEEVYRALDMAWIPPELREMNGEIELARAGTLPRLIEEKDLVADLHMHTDRTDGRDTMEAMVRAAQERGYRYCAITDHSQAVAMAGGFNEDRVRQSVGEIAEVQRKFPDIRVLHGLEVDILAEGDLDLADDALASLDWVIVSLHSRLDQAPAVMTARVLKALSHPAVRAMAHPTARMILNREPVSFDMERVLERAAELGVAMEINAQPDRVDLKDSHARLAREKGVRMVIDTDAHSVRHLDFMRYGVFAARRAGLTRDDVLNTLPYDRFERAVRPRSTVAAGAGAARAATRSAERTAAGARRRPGADPGAAPEATKTAAKARSASRTAARTRVAPKRRPS